MTYAIAFVAYMAVGVFAAAFFRKRFNQDFADGALEAVIALFWPLTVPGMLGAIVGKWANDRKYRQ